MRSQASFTGIVVTLGVLLMNVAVVRAETTAKTYKVFIYAGKAMLDLLKQQGK